MVRIFGPLIGLFFAAALLWSFGVGVAQQLREPDPSTAVKDFHKDPKEDIKFSFDGPFGTYDNRQLQRGFQVYKQVCNNCHSLKQIAFRNLSALGYKPAEVKAIAKEWTTKAKTLTRKPAMPANASTRLPITFRRSITPAPAIRRICR